MINILVYIKRKPASMFKYLNENKVICVKV